MANPLRRRTSGAVQLDHENRIQTLERRIPQDYPQWYGVPLAQVTNANAEAGDFSFTIPDECGADPTECEDRFVTDGDYVLFPTGHGGPFHVYMDVRIVGGFANVDDAYVATSVGDNTPSNRFTLSVVQEVWKDNAPFGSVTDWAHYAWGEFLQGNAGTGRHFWLHWIGTGFGVFDAERERRALKFHWDWPVAADISFSGVANLALDPPGQAAAAFGLGLPPWF